MKFFTALLPAILFLLIGLSSFSAENTSKKIVRGCVGYGFMAEFNWVLNFLEYCAVSNTEPVIYWDKNSSYYSDHGYNGSLNAWEYYFEPVSQSRYVQGDRINIDIHYNRPSCFWAYNEYITNMHMCSKEELQSFKSITHSTFPTYVSYPYGKHHLYNPEFRRYIKESTIDRYIRVKKPIQDKIDSFFKQKMANKITIGVHLRGRHTYGEIPFVPIEEILKEANTHAGPGVQFLVATDQTRLLDQAKKTLNGPVIDFPALRFSITTSPIPGNKLPPRLGEDVLIETLLLSKCDHFIHTLSMVSTIALYFNPELKHTVLY